MTGHVSRHPAGHLPGLDGLRAVAVGVVVAFHSGVLRGGWIGVDVFFALSGFLITGLLVAEAGTTGSIAVREFWLRRFRRLLPGLAALLVLVVVLVPFGLAVRSGGVIGAVTYTTNWIHIVGGTSYWDGFAGADPLEHLWSLAIEEQFYVVWPLVVFAVAALANGDARRGRRVPVSRIVLPTALALAAVSLTVQLAGHAAGWSIDRLYQGTDTRAFAFLLGAALACAPWQRVVGVVRHIAGAVALVVLIGANLALAGDDPAIFRGPLQVVSVAGVMAVFWAAGARTGPLTWRVPRAVGRWSYGIYLFHWPLVVLLAEGSLAARSGWFLFAVVAPVSTALAAASFRFVESPVRSGERIGRRAFPAIAGSVLVSLGAVGIAVATPVEPDTAGERDVSIGPSVNGERVDDDPISDPVRAPRVVVIGDSLPNVATAGLIDVAPAAWSVRITSAPGCLPSFDARDQLVPEPCLDYLNSVDSIVEGADVVVWWWGGSGAEMSVDGTIVETCSTAATDELTKRARWMVDTANDAGAGTLLVPPVPRTDLGEADADGARCSAAVLRSVAQGAATTGVVVSTLDDVVCPRHPDDCERLERYDGLHLRDDAARAAGRHLWGEVALLLERRAAAG
jgi:peptidoglycan/LPS O-acetylase OafA/YrhL